ncbi:1,4-dihydroxy-6-naphthoate synthase [Desulfoluna spongiiphila]|uniref:1,4-dihydroxy-6-naphthoate synthase n=1 Tax=Desulfoluna spongiiphila TaxID=419481 RepID=UPI00125C3CF0|nr:1,4-dihydroxy-6-naphthoate synthase [Desulfoluna spongiiphila]VVS91887.1 1 4-dihydroxy-6-naphtoate synthase [Desulfoluna spongiiphila]
MNRTLAYSTCPNDTFIFHALVHGLVKAEGTDFKTHLHDVEALNGFATERTFDVTKLSFAALGHLRHRYALLRSGAALGRGCGPLIVAKPGFDPKRLKEVPIAVPGLMTTAHLLLGLYLGQSPNSAPMVFDTIMPKVAAGEFEAGLIIHESRFTYADHGLTCVDDLGAFWERETDLPIPLGGIAAARDLPKDEITRIDAAISQSVTYAFAHPNASRDYIRSHAVELSDEVTQSHIDLYVNNFSIDLGDEGIAAVEALMDRAEKSGLIPQSEAPLFV